jgi:hypothetical protein
MRCFDFTGFHSKCANVNVVSGPSGIYVVCLDCRVAGELEAVSAKVSPAEACAVMPAGGIRTAIGKMTPGVKSGYIGSAD